MARLAALYSCLPQFFWGDLSWSSFQEIKNPLLTWDSNKMWHLNPTLYYRRSTQAPVRQMVACCNLIILVAAILIFASFMLFTVKLSEKCESKLPQQKCSNALTFTFMHLNQVPCLLDLEKLAQVFARDFMIGMVCRSRVPIK